EPAGANSFSCSVFSVGTVARFFLSREGARGSVTLAFSALQHVSAPGHGPGASHTAIGGSHVELDPARVRRRRRTPACPAGRPQPPLLTTDHAATVTRRSGARRILRLRRDGSVVSTTAYLDLIMWDEVTSELEAVVWQRVP